MKLIQQLAQIMMANGRRPRPQETPEAIDRSQRMRAMLDVDPPTLPEQLAVLRTAFELVSPSDEDSAALNKARAEEMAADGVGAGALTVGTHVADFSLPDQNGNAVRLYERLESGPVVLSFYRGMWCPFCNLELRALQAALPEFQSLGASLIAISPQKPDRTVSTAEVNALTFAVLTDSGNVVAGAFGVVMEMPQSIVDHQRDDMGFDVADYNASGDRNVPVPATFVIDRDKKITFAFVNPDYRYRVDPSEIVTALGAAV